MTELHEAAKEGNVDALLIAKGKGTVDVNAVDDMGCTALHVASAAGHLEFIRALLQNFKNVDTTALDKKQRTVIQVAPLPLQSQVELLLEKGPTFVSTVKKTNNIEEEEEEENVYRDNDVERSDVVNPRVLRKVILCVVFPFIILIFINGPLFALQYVAVSLIYYFVTLGYFVSEITIRPPWYHHRPGSSTFTSQGCPEYWGGCVHDPWTDLHLCYEDVSFASTDGYTLRGWYVPPPSKGACKTCVVLVHGGGRDRRAWLRHVPFIHNAGYGCLLFDFREHGLSDGNMRGFTYGMKERFDVVAACKFMRGKYGFKRVCAMGTSVGASSVIMAAAIDKTIDLIIAENAILTCETLQDQQIVSTLGGYFSRRAYSKFFFMLFRRTSSFWLNYRIGNKPSRHCQALHCIAKISPRPILLMHGTEDKLVPCRHSLKLFEVASEPKVLYISKGAFHCGLYNTHKDEYERQVLGFLSKYGEQQDSSDVPTES
ncbi:putative Ankyrin repeats (many copies) [Trypanosoma vivax]|uniref:AB hydrolase-1 domain-containing protein n=1 Tax=Trypanosoma vivax (strain Y486) TaxID=1055687 RepID=G0U1G4_TRYVY|nr:hypothetical protein TRVL_05732 [Trypanosoma vivax]KAH8609073.1 putative Ankyrin repeats (many copies) [Trypanosoma vivax]CCC49920.1 conserved hypothetical protein [Trypanosoma vivax Y486]